MPTPTLGRVVNYTTAAGKVCTATIICTETSWSPGHYKSHLSASERQSAVLLDGRSTQSVPGGVSVNPYLLDVDGDLWVPSTVPKPKEGCVHLEVIAPNGNRWTEFNVSEAYDPPTQPDQPNEGIDQRCMYAWPPLLPDERGSTASPVIASGPVEGAGSVAVDTEEVQA